MRDESVSALLLTSPADSKHGYSVAHLGADLPDGGLPGAIRRINPKMILRGTLMRGCPASRRGSRDNDTKLMTIPIATLSPPTPGFTPRTGILAATYEGFPWERSPPM